MKVIESSDVVKFPDEVDFTVNKRLVQVTGPRGTLKRSFRHLSVEIVKEGKKVRHNGKFLTQQKL